MPRGTEYPCPGCGRIVAYARPEQYGVGFDGRGGGKGRARHNCPHGQPCIFGSRTRGHGMNYSTCEACRREQHSRASETGEIVAGARGEG
jgi:hypothetical protein